MLLAATHFSLCTILCARAHTHTYVQTIFYSIKLNQFYWFYQIVDFKSLSICVLIQCSVSLNSLPICSHNIINIQWWSLMDRLTRFSASSALSKYASVVMLMNPLNSIFGLLFRLRPKNNNGKTSANLYSKRVFNWFETAVKESLSGIRKNEECKIDNCYCSDVSHNPWDRLRMYLPFL